MTTPTPVATRTIVLPAVIGSEWIKFRTVRSTLWSLVAMVGMMIGFAALFCAAFDERFDRRGIRALITFDPAGQSLHGLFLAQLAVGVLGVLIMSSEYTSGMIRTSVAAVPQRRVLLTAKFIVFGASAVVVSLVSAFAAFFVGQWILDTKHLGTTISSPNVLRAVVGAAAYLTIVGIIGLALGAIIRRTAGAISCLVALVFALPILAQALPDPWNKDVSHLLPGGVAPSLFSVLIDPGDVSPLNALVVLVIWVVVLVAAGNVLISRRDV